MAGNVGGAGNRKNKGGLGAGTGGVAEGGYYKRDFNYSGENRRGTRSAHPSWVTQIAPLAAPVAAPGYAAGERMIPPPAPPRSSYNPRLPNIPSWIPSTNWGAAVPTNPNPRLPALPTTPAIGGTNWGAPTLNSNGILTAFGITPPRPAERPIVTAGPGSYNATHHLYNPNVDFYAAGGPLTPWWPTPLSPTPPVWTLPPTPPSSGSGGGYGGYGGGGGGGGGRGGRGGRSANDYEKWLTELLGRWNI